MHRTTRRATAASAVIAALLASAGTATASRGPSAPKEEADAAAVAIQLNGSKVVAAAASGDQSDSDSGPWATLPGLFEARTLDAAAEARSRGGAHARADARLGHARLTVAGQRIEAVALRAACEAARGDAHGDATFLFTKATADALGLHGEASGDGVLVDVAPNTTIQLGAASIVLNEQHRTVTGGEAGFDVHGVTARVGGILVASLANAHCHVRTTAPSPDGPAPTPPSWPQAGAGASAGAGAGARLGYLTVGGTAWAAGRF